MIRTSLLAAAGVACLAVGFAASVHANPPTIDHFTSPSVFVDDTSCAFPINVDGVDKVTQQQYFDKDGNPTLIAFHDQFIATASANGKSVSESDHYTVVIDLVTGSETWTGQPFRIRPTGGGHWIQRDAGRIVFANDGSIVIDHGPHPFGEGDTAAYCAALAP